VKDLVILSAVVVGEGHSVECKVRAIENRLPGANVPPAYSDMRVMTSDAIAALPDGLYEIVVSHERIPVRRERGEFLARA
jgi:hypothetical protein